MRGFGRRVGSVVAGILLVVSIGCGGDDVEDVAARPSTPGTSPSDESSTTVGAVDLPDVCGLLTSAEVETATGLPILTGPDDERQHRCEWLLEGEGPTNWANVVLDPAFPEAQCVGFHVSDEEELGGMGHRAFYVPDFRTGHVNVCTPEYMVAVEFFHTGSTDEELRTGAEEMARIVAGRLGLAPSETPTTLREQELPDACAALLPAEVEDAADSPLLREPRVEGPHSCSWAAADLTVDLTFSSNPVDTCEYVNEGNDPVDGLPYPAYWDADPSTRGVDVCADEFSIAVRVGSFDRSDEDLRQIATELATIVVERTT